LYCIVPQLTIHLESKLEDMNLENTKAQMRKGVLELCVLSIIEEQEAYPSDIIGRLKQAELIVVEGTLYPLLSRLKNAELLTYTWKESKTGPPRKYYHLTDTGAVFLENLKGTWKNLTKAVNHSFKKTKAQAK